MHNKLHKEFKIILHKLLQALLQNDNIFRQMLNQMKYSQMPIFRNDLKKHHLLDTQIKH